MPYRTKRNYRKNKKSRKNRNRNYRGGLFNFTNDSKTVGQNMDNWEKVWKNKKNDKGELEWAVYDDYTNYPGYYNIGQKPTDLESRLIGDQRAKYGVINEEVRKKYREDLKNGLIK
jgi:hypothetical protein